MTPRPSHSPSFLIAVVPFTQSGFVRKCNVGLMYLFQDCGKTIWLRRGGTCFVLFFFFFYFVNSFLSEFDLFWLGLRWLLTIFYYDFTRLTLFYTCYSVLAHLYALCFPVRSSKGWKKMSRFFNLEARWSQEKSYKFGIRHMAPREGYWIAYSIKEKKKVYRISGNKGSLVRIEVIDELKRRKKMKKS